VTHVIRRPAPHPPPAAGNDDELMTSIRAGRVEALGRLYDRYGARAYRVARSVCHRERDAEQAVLSAFTSIWENRAACGPSRRAPAAWLLAVVLAEAVAISEPASDGRPGHSLTQLPEGQREIVALAAYGQLSVTEIAQQFELVPRAVKHQMSLGLDRLRSGAERVPAS